MSGEFTFNGVSSAEFGLLVNNLTNYGAPSRVVDKIQIPYRNGDLLIDTGTYNNYIVTYEIALINDAVADTRAIAEWLLAPQGYCRLTDSYNTDEFRYAAYYNQINYTMAHLNRYGKATISFDCKPQRYLTSGETETVITNGSITLANPQEMVAKPFIKIYGSGTCTVNGFDITVGSGGGIMPVHDYVVVDCESLQCYGMYYNHSLNMNAYVQLPNGFPVLDPGNNTVSKGTIATKVAITPRWWRL